MGNSGKAEDREDCFPPQHIMITPLCTPLKTEKEDATYPFRIPTLYPVSGSHEFVSTVKENLCLMYAGRRSLRLDGMVI